MSTIRCNYAQPEEKFIKIYSQKIEESFKRGTCLKLPLSLSTETVLMKICQLTTDNNVKGLKELMTTCDNRLLYSVVKLLARRGNEKAVNLLIDQFGAEKYLAILGYAWGGHLNILSRNNVDQWKYHHELISGFALGRHIESVNFMLMLGTEKELIKTALHSYEEGFHVENLNDTLELITLTTNQPLKEMLADALQKKIQTLDVDLLLEKAEKLASLMKTHKINYSKSLQILSEVEKSKLLVHPIDDQKNLTQSSSKFFKQTKISDFYQKNSIEQLGSSDITGQKFGSII